MEYLIKSLKWTKHNKCETWYGPNRNGYTGMICDAGIYTEKDKYEMTALEAEKTILFIPLTQKLINKGKKQINKRLEILNNHLLITQGRYVKEINLTNDDIKKFEGKKAALMQMNERVR